MSIDSESASELQLRERCLRAAVRTVQMFDEPLPWEVDGPDTALFQLVYPLVCHTVEQVKAALKLIEVHLAYPAEANARIAYQHAITAQWMLLTKDSAKGIGVEMLAQLDKQVSEFGTIVDLPEELLDDTDEAERVGGSLRRHHEAQNFKTMCDRFGTEHLLYLTFRRLSGPVHPSLATMHQHLILPPPAASEPFAPTLRPHSDPVPSLDLLMAVAMSAVFAVNAVETLRLGQPRLARVVHIARENHIPPSLAGDVDHQSGHRPA